jgi:hypothetical protein
MTPGARFGVRFLTAFPELQAKQDDRILIRIGHEEPVVLHRVLPVNYAAVVKALTSGIAWPLDSQQRPADLLCLLGAVPAPIPTPSSRSSRLRTVPHGHLTLIEVMPRASTKRATQKGGAA